MTLLKKLKAFLQESPENRTQLFVFLGFVILPFIGLSLLYTFVCIFWL